MEKQFARLFQQKEPPDTLIEAVLTLLALNNGKTSGTIGCRTSDPDLGLAVLAENEQTALIGRIGMSQSLAFGGGNAVLILEGSGL